MQYPKIVPITDTTADNAKLKTKQHKIGVNADETRRWPLQAIVLGPLTVSIPRQSRGALLISQE